MSMSRVEVLERRLDMDVVPPAQVEGRLSDASIPTRIER